jgi:hypothetical protein
MIGLPNHATGADGVKIAVLRKGRASFDLFGPLLSGDVGPQNENHVF